MFFCFVSKSYTIYVLFVCWMSRFIYLAANQICGLGCRLGGGPQTTDLQAFVTQSPPPLRLYNRGFTVSRRACISCSSCYEVVGICCNCRVQLITGYNQSNCKEKGSVVLTLCHSYLKPYCMGRKTAFFFSGHLNLRTTPETGLPSRKKKIITIKLRKTEW